jgi:hypothetical protein
MIFMLIMLLRVLHGANFRLTRCSQVQPQITVSSLLPMLFCHNQRNANPAGQMISDIILNHLGPSNVFVVITIMQHVIEVSLDRCLHVNKYSALVFRNASISTRNPVYSSLPRESQTFVRTTRSFRLMISHRLETSQTMAAIAPDPMHRRGEI